MENCPNLMPRTRASPAAVREVSQWIETRNTDSMTECRDFGIFGKTGAALVFPVKFGQSHPKRKGAQPLLSFLAGQATPPGGNCCWCQTLLEGPDAGHVAQLVALGANVSEIALRQAFHRTTLGFIALEARAALQITAECGEG